MGGTTCEVKQEGSQKVSPPRGFLKFGPPRVAPRGFRPRGVPEEGSLKWGFPRWVTQVEPQMLSPTLGILQGGSSKGVHRGVPYMRAPQVVP